jgi:hypothetical protein
VAFALVAADIVDVADTVDFGSLAKAPQPEESECAGPY